MSNATGPSDAADGDDGAPMVYAQQINVPYSYTAGRVEAAFLRGLADRRILGSTSDAGVLVPARPFAPDGRRTGDLVEVADRGVLRGWTTRHHDGTATTWGMVRLDGADSDLLHVVEAPADRVAVGLRVVARWAAEPTTEITAIEAFVPDESA